MELVEKDELKLQYDLTEEQENKEIVRRYRALLRGLKPKLKSGDKELALRLAEEVMATIRAVRA